MREAKLLVLAACATVLVTFAVWLSSCAEFKPVAKTVNDVARDLCAIFYGKKQGISVEDAAKAFCATEKQIAPFLDEVLSAEQRAGAKSLQARDGGAD